LIYFILSLYSFLSFADPTFKWANALEVVEKHEFYTANEVITKPKDSWQTLFAVVYPDVKLNTYKDCVFFRVPGLDLGILKIKTISASESCEKYLFSVGDEETQGVKALQFHLNENFLNLNITLDAYKIERWNVTFLNKFQRPTVSGLMSSGQYQFPKLIHLASVQKAIPQQKSILKKDKLCHAIAEDCQELSLSICQTCEEGWYEIPNGCNQGPKYCGVLNCGQRNQPACRRGVHYQRLKKKYECRLDSSFAFCAKGLKVQCEGNLPFCI
jgi:hypothetical protein